MISRVESAAATRRALLDAAAELLDLGGPEAVTLREVGARAGVSRGAPYRHFPDKESLLAAIATESWEHVGDRIQALRADSGLPASEQLRGALLAMIGIGRQKPHLYQLMFTTPSSNPEAVLRAASRSQDEFLAIVAAIVGEADARRYGALLLTSAHGIAGLELAGHLTAEKWQTNADELVDTLVRLVAQPGAGR
ncbi:TetR/AcrR family transcriptional regulator [Dactylosporangium sp. CA-052675]|uniref:TetR/AcrR family transcriptional regulator n=1 Tax=Dactylosporangium sp. CA-052675 TaxID=3239927 RepID=UPI003D8CE028